MRTERLRQQASMTRATSGSRRETLPTRSMRTINGMNGQLKPQAGDDGTHAASVDEFYVRRINWLITIGRSDLIDEIADDCERRRTAPPPAHPAHDGRNIEAAPVADGQPPGPVEAGTRLAAARLNRAPRPTFRHRSESRTIRG
jgi:hypothetical protein